MFAKIFCLGLDIWVPQIVKSYMLDPCRRQNLLMGVPEGVRIVHRARLGRGEHIRVVRVLLVFQDQQIHRLLRDGDDADGVAGLGLAHLELPVDAVHLFRHGDGHIFHVQVSPEEGQQLAPAQAAGEFQVVRREQTAPVGLLEIGPNLLGKQNFHLLLLNLRELAPLRRVVRDQLLLHRLGQRRAEHPVDAVDEAVAQPLVLQLNMFVPLNTPGGFQPVIELLDLDRGELVQPDITDPGDDVLFDVVIVVVRRLLPDGGLGIGLEPQPHPFGYRVFATTDYVYLSIFLNGLGQLFLAFLLGFRQHVFVDGLARCRVAARCVAALPAAIGTFSHWHPCTPSSSLPQAGNPG